MYVLGTYMYGLVLSAISFTALQISQDKLSIIFSNDTLIRTSGCVVLLQTDQDELSQEDDSVNRVSSMIASLQHLMCVSPSCEPTGLSELASGVGQGFIDTELVGKVLKTIV